MNRSGTAVIGGRFPALADQGKRADHPLDEGIDVAFHRRKRLFDHPQGKHRTKRPARVFQCYEANAAPATSFVGVVQSARTERKPLDTVSRWDGREPLGRFGVRRSGRIGDQQRSGSPLIDVVVTHRGMDAPAEVHVDVRHQRKLVIAKDTAATQHFDRAVNGGSGPTEAAGQFGL